MEIQDIKCFALDMDGTIYLGEQWIDGAKEFLNAIERTGRKYYFLTNNSSKNAQVYVDKLHRMGLDVSVDKIITSGQATIHYLKQNMPGKKIFLMGNPLLREEFEASGIIIDEQNPDVVVTAFDTTLTWDKLCKVCDLVRDGLPFVATHPDYNCPTETGFVPDIGSFHELIHASAFRYPDVIVGKPYKPMIDYLLYRTGQKKEDIAMVGDRLYTDIAAGVNHGLTGVLVLSGETKMKDLDTSEVKPHHIFDSVKDIISLL